MCAGSGIEGPARSACQPQLSSSTRWNEQAARSAEAYLDYSSFSRQGLIEQLEFEGFTRAQATYGVDQTGL
jgi:hypothetical protein